MPRPGGARCPGGRAYHPRGLDHQELKDHGEEAGLKAEPELAGKEAWSASDVGRLFLWDSAKELTVPYAQRSPGCPDLFRPLLPPRVPVD